MRARLSGLTTFLAIEAAVGATVYVLAVGSQMNSRDGSGYSRGGMAAAFLLVAAIPAIALGVATWRLAARPPTSDAS